jgi:biopolymer transport protein TolR
MGMSVGGVKHGILADVNVVPLIDILLVLLVIFMIIRHSQMGLKAVVPYPSEQLVVPEPEVVVVQVRADGSLLINQEPVQSDGLRARLEEVFQKRADRIAFIRGESLVEFGAVARVLDVMHSAGIASVGLLTPALEKNH